MIKQLKIDDPHYLWNVDEHGTEDVLKHSKVVGIKGIKANQTVCREKSCRSHNAYICKCSWICPCPLWLFIGGKFHDNWHKNAPPRVLVHFSKKGYINKYLFSEYGKMFLYHLHAENQLDKPNLVVVMDSHYSHTFNYLYMKAMYEWDVKVMGIKISYITHDPSTGQESFQCF